jgi:hypothetical protein
LTVLFLSRLALSQRFVTLRQTFVRRRHGCGRFSVGDRRDLIALARDGSAASPLTVPVLLGRPVELSKSLQRTVRQCRKLAASKFRDDADVMPATSGHVLLADARAYDAVEAARAGIIWRFFIPSISILSRSQQRKGTTATRARDLLRT